MDARKKSQTTMEALLSGGKPNATLLASIKVRDEQDASLKRIMLAYLADPATADYNEEKQLAGLASTLMRNSAFKTALAATHDLKPSQQEPIDQAVQNILITHLVRWCLSGELLHTPINGYAITEKGNKSLEALRNARTDIFAL